MAIDELRARIRDLFIEAGTAHNEAFASTDGVDPDWPIWYADYLEDELPTHLGRDLSRSEIVYLLWGAMKAQAEDESPEPWPEYYARFLGGD